MDELKPCPFCGGKAKLITHRNYATNGHADYYVECGTDGCTMCLGGICFGCAEEAIEAWNRRTSDDESGSD